MRMVGRVGSVMLLKETFKYLKECSFVFSLKKNKEKKPEKEKKLA